MVVNYRVLAGWLAFLGLLAALVVVFLPASGWGWTAGFEQLGCRQVGACREPEPAPSPTATLERAPISRLLDCQASGLGSCTELRTAGIDTVKILVGDGRYLDQGLLIAGGLEGGALRYVRLVGDLGGREGDALFCAYRNAAAGEVDDLVGGLSGGELVLFTVELRWDDGDRRFRTFTEEGEPACWLGLVDGQRWVP